MEDAIVLSTIRHARRSLNWLFKSLFLTNDIFSEGFQGGRVANSAGLRLFGQGIEVKDNSLSKVIRVIVADSSAYGFRCFGRW
jgi:hypothetical protein